MPRKLGKNIPKKPMSRRTKVGGSGSRRRPGTGKRPTSKRR